MNTIAQNSYSSVSRAKKGFEIVNDNPAIVESNWNIPKVEAERVFGTNGTVPEGTVVRPYTVGTSVSGYTTVAGDLKIIDGIYEVPYGITLQKVQYFPNNFRENDMMSVSYGERVSVATGVFNGVFQNFNANAQTTFNPGTKLFVKASGQATVDDGSLDTYGSGNVIGKIIEEGFVEYDARTGSPLVAASGGIADEIMAKCYFDYRS
jgi:hypothetical protein